MCEFLLRRVYSFEHRRSYLSSFIDKGRVSAKILAQPNILVIDLRKPGPSMANERPQVKRCEQDSQYTPPSGALKRSCDVSHHALGPTQHV